MGNGGVEIGSADPADEDQRRSHRRGFLVIAEVLEDGFAATCEPDLVEAGREADAGEMIGQPRYIVLGAMVEQG